MGHTNSKKKSLRNSKNIILIFLFCVFILSTSAFIMSENNTNSEEKSIIGIKIIDFESPVKLGEFSEFTYMIETDSKMVGDVLINFQLEKDGKIITSGSDTALIKAGGLVESTKIFLPSTLESGVYTLNIKANYNNHEIQSFRVIEVRVRGTSALINSGTDKFKTYFMISLTVLFVLVLSLLIYLERKKIDVVLAKEQKFFKKHRRIILVFILFLILGVLLYFFSSQYYLPSISIYIYLGAVIVIFLLSRFTRKKKK